MGVLLLILCTVGLSIAKNKVKVKKPPPPTELKIEILDQGTECESPTQTGNVLHVFFFLLLVFGFIFTLFFIVHIFASVSVHFI
jgi:hypothetical protein